MGDELEKLYTHAYYIGYAHAGKAVGVFLDAEQQVFNLLHQGAVIQSLEIRGLIGREMSFEDYLKYMLLEARTSQV